MSENETITISLAKYNSLLKDRRFLNSLRSAGIDNTEAYDYGLDIFYETYPEYKDD